jgi:hypothetical protein
MDIFTVGDASFFVSISSSGQILATYAITLNERELPLLIKIQDFFGTGNIRKNPNNLIQLTVSRIAHLNEIIIKHFNEYSLVGAKLSNFLIWSEIVILMNEKAHLTPEGNIKIKFLVDKLNK